MKKYLIVYILLIGILLLCGCEKDTEQLETYCDKKYGIEYIRDNGVYRGGITVRLDKNGNVIHCK